MTDRLPSGAALRPAAASRLPPQPDFERIESRAAVTARQRGRVLGLVGEINFAWSNNESLLIYLIMLLLRTDEASAAVTFATLNTTRARLDLVERLARLHLRDMGLRKSLLAATSTMSALTRVRNDMNHCIFVVAPDGGLTHTQTLKLEEGRGRMAFGIRREIDEKRLADLARSISDLKELNRTIWALLPKIEEAMPRASA